MIYLTGDCHGDFTGLQGGNVKNCLLNQGKGTEVIVCGDLGLLVGQRQRAYIQSQMAFEAAVYTFVGTGES